jgi:hypothetical protein
VTSIAKDLEELSAWLGHTYRLDTGRYVKPTEVEFEKILDEARRVLYDEAVGTTLRLGRLLVERQNNDLDVYIHVGTTTKE